MIADLPDRMPTRAKGASIALALARREHFDAYVYGAEICAKMRAAAIDALTVELESNRKARALWRGTDTGEKTYSYVLARVGLRIKSGEDFTRLQLDAAIKARTRLIAEHTAVLASHNRAAIAGRTALALFRDDDPPPMTYAQAVARAGQSVDRTPIVNVAAPQVDVHMPERRPQSITATKLADGTLTATVREAAA